MGENIIDTKSREEKISEIIKIISFDYDEKIKLKIPLFQRDYVWNTKDDTIPNLLYSLKNGFPIGNLTMWSRPLDAGKLEYILIDGLQRTFSIVNILSQPWKYISHKLHKLEYQKICTDDDVKIPKVIDNDETKRIEHRITDKMLRQNNRLKEFNTLKEAQDYINNYNTFDKNDENRKRDEYSLMALNNIINWILNELKEETITVNFINGATEDQIVEIFTLMNSNGKKLNKFEKFSAHWSLTPIQTNNLDSNFLKLIKDRNTQYCETLSKLYPNDNKYVNKCEESLREIGEDVIPSDYLSSFLYFLFKDKKYNLKDVYISNNRLIDNEVSIFLLMNFLGNESSKEKWDFKTFGEKLSNKINENKGFTKDSIETLLKTIKLIEGKFELLDFMNSFSKNEDDSKTLFDTLKISTHFVNSLINQGVSFFDDLESLEDETIQLKLLETKVETTYSFGASPAEISIKAYKDKFLVKNYSNEGKKNLFNSLQNKIFPKERTKKSFSDIDKILTLYTHSIDVSAKKKSIHFDHIFPRSIIEKMKINDIELINLINSYANSQILSEKLNINKGNSFIPDEFQYDNLINDANFIEKLNNYDFSKEKYKELIQQLKEIKNNKWELAHKDDLYEIHTKIKNVLEIRLEFLNDKIKHNIFKISN